MNELRQRWDAYHANVLHRPLNVVDIQVLECRRAWFAGAAAVADLMQRFRDSDTLSAAQQRQLLDELMTQIREFQFDVAIGRA